MTGSVPCGPAPELEAQLSEKYGETLAAYGVSGGHLIAVYASPETGSWTIAEISPSGIACVKGAGKGWTEVEAQVVEEAA